MYKLPVIIKDDYIVFLEPSKAGVLLHCEVRRWSKSVKVALLSDFAKLQELHGHNRMFALHDEHRGAKHIKFLKRMGFRHFRNLTQGHELWVINSEI